MDQAANRALILERMMPVPESGCWIWMLSTDPCGYGRVKRGGKLLLAHRVAYEAWNGRIEEGKELDHLCRVRCCVNPKHLEPVSHRENIRRGDLKTNSHNGSKTHCPRGHELSGANLVVERNWSGGLSRRCKTCSYDKNRERARKRYLAMKGSVRKYTRKAKV